METTTGSPDAGDSIQPEVVAAMAAAEHVLSQRLGAPIKLADPEDLGGHGRSIVVRVRVAATPFSLPKTLVVKRYGPPSPDGSPDIFVQETVSYQLLTALAHEERMCPEMFAHDGGQRLVVLEDVGRAPTLAEKLLGDDARSAERALLSWARLLGRLHASTAGREADFDALTRRLGMPRQTDPIAARGHAMLDELPELLRARLKVDTSAAVHRFARTTSWLLEPGRYRAFSPCDTGPYNNVITNRGMRLRDFEGGCWRNVVLDAGCLRVPFPACAWSYALPAGMPEAMVAAWRAEARHVWPDLDRDEFLLPGLLDAELFWVWWLTWCSLPRLRPDESSTDSGSRALWRAVMLSARWRALAARAQQAQRAALAEHAEAVVHALRRRHPSLEDLAPYPAFR